MRRECRNRRCRRLRCIAREGTPRQTLARAASPSSSSTIIATRDAASTASPACRNPGALSPRNEGHSWNSTKSSSPCPTAPAKRVRDILRLSREAGLVCRTVPSVDQLGDRLVSASAASVRWKFMTSSVVRPVEIDGRCRDARNSSGRTSSWSPGRAAASAAELCRQILSYGPATLHARRAFRAASLSSSSRSCSP